MQLTNWFVTSEECRWLYSLSAVTSKVIRSVTDEVIADLFICLTLRICDQLSIDCTQRCKEMYHWLRIWQFKYNSFECLSLLDECSYDTDFLSIFCCFNSTLFIVEIYEISLHDWQEIRLNYLRQQRELKTWRDLISEIIYALSLLIFKKGWETAKLNIEVKELLKTLNEFNIDLTVVF